MDTNLLTHQIVMLIQELALSRYQGDRGFQAIVALLDGGLREVASDVNRAGFSEYRKLYHVAWKPILEAVCETGLQETLNDRFKKLVF